MIYVASSWRNLYQPQVVQKLRADGHEVYDFRNPATAIGDTLTEGSLSEKGRGQGTAFDWAQIEPEWQQWDADRFIAALDHPRAQAGFKSDFDALKECEICVLVLPCNRSSHLELGYAVGKNKITIVLMLGENEPELMYLMVSGIVTTIDELRSWLKVYV